MSEQTRAALKVFGINVTKLEEAVHNLEKESDKSSVERYVEASKEVNESLVELLIIITKIHERGVSALAKSLTGKT
ncbi:MAG: hypothetical protein QXG52_07475 [Candidatus Caldarchaeum sp.]